MAKYQYRLSGVFEWPSSNGNALVALQNKGSSGKRITIRAMEIESRRLRVNAVNERAYVMAGRGSGDSGTVVIPAPMDSGTPLPSGVVVRANDSFLMTDIIGRASIIGGGLVNVSLAHPGLAGGPMQPNKGLGGCWNAGKRKASPVVEGIVINAGESFGLAHSAGGNTNPMMSYTITFRANGGVFVATAQSETMTEGFSPLWIKNGSASPITILEWGAVQLGSSAVSPYIQVVPFSGVPLETVDTTKAQPVADPMDSAYPAASTWLSIFEDAPLTPFGAPIQYASDVGAGAPKGFNYLATKDFLGPTYRSILFEGSQHNTGSLPPDNWGFDWPAKGKEIGIRRGAGLVIRPGEGIAAVISAETVGATAVLFAGYNPVVVSMIFDVENLVQPYLSLSGLQSGSDIVVLVAGTGTILQQIDAYSGTDWAWAYDPDLVSTVDVCIYKPGFVPLAFRNLTLPAEGVSVPVSQASDRNYQ